MKWHAAIVGLLAVSIAACSDSVSPPEPPQITPQAARANQPTTIVEDVTGVIAGGSFTGAVQITQFAMEDGEMVVSGVLNGTATVAGIATEVVNQGFTAPAAMTSGIGECRIVFLDLGPLFLDVLGLEVDLAQVVLDVTAQAGAGNLLGNLLCAVVHLLDGPGGGGGLTRLLDLINGLLG